MKRLLGGIALAVSVVGSDVNNFSLLQAANEFDIGYCFPTRGPTTCESDMLEDYTIGLINNLRTNRGLGRVVKSSHLAEVAALHLQDRHINFPTTCESTGMYKDYTWSKWSILEKSWDECCSTDAISLNDCVFNKVNELYEVSQDYKAKEVIIRRSFVFDDPCLIYTAIMEELLQNSFIIYVLEPAMVTIGVKVWGDLISIFIAESAVGACEDITSTSTTVSTYTYTSHPTQSPTTGYPSTTFTYSNPTTGTVTYTVTPPVGAEPTEYPGCAVIDSDLTRFVIDRINLMREAHKPDLPALRVLTELQGTVEYHIQDLLLQDIVGQPQECSSTIPGFEIYHWSAQHPNPNQPKWAPCCSSGFNMFECNSIKPEQIFDISYSLAASEFVVKHDTIIDSEMEISRVLQLNEQNSMFQKIYEEDYSFIGAKAKGLYLEIFLSKADTFNYC